jgi:hypothetical protein
MADGDHEKQSMSQAVAIIYRALIDEIRFAKQQQWLITYYLLLVLAAIFAIGKAIGPMTACEKILAIAVVVVAVCYGSYILISLQCYMDESRKRLQDIEREDSSCFTPEERKFLRLDQYQSTIRRGLPILILLILASVFSGLLVEYALLFRSELR